MNDPKPIFMADSCIGGLSVLKSLWETGTDHDVVFLADYEVNPLGVKSDDLICEVVHKWLRAASEVADTLVVGCNTLSIRHHQLLQTNRFEEGPASVITMVDCFRSLVVTESARLANRRILIIGTAYTASQSTYTELLQEGCPGVQVKTIAATELERAIARMQPWSIDNDSVLTKPLRAALAETDFAVLACTCFPMAQAVLERLFPNVIFLDPGTYCGALLAGQDAAQTRSLELRVTGDVMDISLVDDFARKYLPKHVHPIPAGA